MTERPHGYARYRLDACRCYVCGFAVSQYERNRQKAIATGTWQPYLDAEPVRQHLLMLSEHGIGYKRAADLAGVGRTAARNVIYGRGPERPEPAKRIKTATGRKLLAVRPGLTTVADAALIDSIGTHRRIQGMCVKGWSFTAQSERVGWSVSNYSRLLLAEAVTGRTARLVAGLYNELSAREPEPGCGASRARRMAAGRYWLTPAVWDDDEIDDPAAVPCVLPPVDGSDPTTDEYALTVAYFHLDVPINRQLRDEFIRRMTVGGYSLAEIAPYARTTTNMVSFIRSRIGLGYAGRSAVAA